MRPPSFCTPLRAVWDVKGQLTETIWYPSQDKEKPKTILLFIPGNPGLVEYYSEFLESIYQASNCALEIYGVSHLGHSVGPHLKQTNTLYSLQDQIDHKVNCLDTLQQSNPGARFILMGHSVGSYICVEILKQREKAPVSRLIALFPTLYDIALTPNGVNLSNIFSGLPSAILCSLSTLVSYMSAPLRQRLVGLITGQVEPCVKVTAHQLLHGSVIRNVLHMASQEMEHVRELDQDFYTAHVDKFIMYYSKVDQWAPLDHYEYMKNRFPDHAHIYLCEQDIPHAFILNPSHAETMAKKVYGWISNTDGEDH